LKMENGKREKKFKGEKKGDKVKEKKGVNEE